MSIACRIAVAVFSFLCQPAGVPSPPSMAEAFLLADDPTGVRVYWSEVTNDRGSEVSIESITPAVSSRYSNRLRPFFLLQIMARVDMVVPQ